MCIIAIKPKNVPLQPETTLRTCFTRNPDGAGYMFTINNEVIIKKGLMTFDNFYKSLMYDYNKYELEFKSLVMHFRIGTSGESATGCTHPFPITNDYSKLELLRVKTNLGVCHNGIISDFNDRKGKYSDTELYISHVITPLIKLNINAYKFKDIQELILKTTLSKWAFLNKSDEIYIVGDFIKEGEYLYSNSTYESYKAITTPYYSDDYDDYWEGDYGDSWYTKQKKKQDKIDKKNDAKTGDNDLVYFDFVEDDDRIYIIGDDNKAETIYNKLLLDNVICYDPLDNNDKDNNGYKEIDSNDFDRFYFDKKWNIYERKHNSFQLIGTEGVGYTKNDFQIRIDFED